MIDAHQHCWQLARGDYGWLTPALAPIHRDVSPDDWLREAAPCGVERSILVQAAPTEAETHYLLQLASTTPHVAGVVGWTDFSAPDALPRIAICAAAPLLVGLRPMLHDLDDDTWMLRDDVTRAVASMAPQGLVFDALVRSRHLTYLLEFARRHPTLAIVIDHGAKPDIAHRQWQPWAERMAALARCANVQVKLSGLVTEAAASWREDDLGPYVRHLLVNFGVRRVIWGSDWPVLELAGSYRRWFDAASSLTASLAADARALVFGGNAARTYLQLRARR
jgi:L-fuconolactonase